jgi:hypothetical protein
MCVKVPTIEGEEMAKISMTKEEEFLNYIIKHISIAFDVSTLGTELRLSLDENKLLDVASRIASEAIDFTGKGIDKVHIRIGDYDLKAKMKTETRHTNHKIGFVKEDNEQ